MTFKNNSKWKIRRNKPVLSSHKPWKTPRSRESESHTRMLTLMESFFPLGGIAKVFRASKRALSISRGDAVNELWNDIGKTGKEKLCRTQMWGKISYTPAFRGNAENGVFVVTLKSFRMDWRKWENGVPKFLSENQRGVDDDFW